MHLQHLLTDLPDTNTKAWDMTSTHNHLQQEGETTQQDVTTPITEVTQGNSSDSSSDWEVLDALHSTGVRHKVKVSNNKGTFTPTHRQELGP